MNFYTNEGVQIPALTTIQMREVDRIAVEEFNLGILQMMENAGRNLAQLIISLLGDQQGKVTILAGPGGNGGGGICCARHLHNHGLEIALVLSKSRDSLGYAARNQLSILEHSGVHPLAEDEVEDAISRSTMVVDAIIGYSLQGAPRGRATELIEMCNGLAHRVISLDIPTGMDSTSGATPGVLVHADTTMTLALPKIGLGEFEGDLFLADIGIPPEVYQKLGIQIGKIFLDQYVIPIHYR